MKRTKLAAGRYMNGRLYVKTAAGDYVELALVIAERRAAQ